MNKIILLAIVFYFLAALQTSFFGFLKIFPNLILIGVIVISFFEERRSKLGFISAFIGGLFLDIFSDFPLGTVILSLILTVILVKYLLSVFHNLNIFIAAFFGTIFYHFFIYSSIAVLSGSLNKFFFRNVFNEFIFWEAALNGAVMLIIKKWTRLSKIKE